MHLFTLFGLSALYVPRLENLGITKMINKTRLTNSTLDHYKETIQEQTDGKNTILVFQAGNQHWWPVAMKMLVQRPVALPADELTLYLPNNPDDRHPLSRLPPHPITEVISIQAIQ